MLLTCSAQVNTDSLWRAWQDPHAADTVRLQAVTDLIRKKYVLSDPDSAFVLAQQQYDFAMKQKRLTYAAGALNTMGRVMHIRSNYAEALNYYSRSLKIREQINDVKGITASLNNIGMIYADQGMASKAVEYYFRCLKIREEAGDKRGQANSLGNIGDSYFRDANYDKALEYYERGLAIVTGLKEKRSIGLSLTSIGMVYKEKNDTAKAADYLRQAIALLQEAGDKENLARAYYNLGAVYESAGEHRNAIGFIEKSLQMRIELQDSVGQMKSLCGLGLCYEGLKDYDQAIVYGERALQIARKTNVPRTSRSVAELLFRLYERTGNYKAALEMYQFQVAARDSMHNDDLKNSIFKEQLKYDYEKQALIAKAENDLKMSNLRLEAERRDAQKNAWLIISVGFSILLVSAGIFFINSFKQKKIIAEQKANLMKQKLLVSQINPHFIFNSLNAIQNYVFTQDALRAGDYLSRLSGLMRMILEFSRQDYITVEEEHDFLKVYLEVQQLRFRDKFSFSIYIDEKIDRESVQIPPMLAQPFVENAIEHGIFHKQEKGNISIRMMQQNGNLYYEIADDGVGLAAAKSFKENSGRPHKSLATIITKERLETHLRKSPRNSSAEIDVKDNPAPGTGVSVRFEIPWVDEGGAE
jgi:tetratricopeptide (TPR) repeat protein